MLVRVEARSHAFEFRLHDVSAPTSNDKHDFEFHVRGPGHHVRRLLAAGTLLDQMARPVTLPCHLGVVGHAGNLQRLPAARELLPKDGQARA